jgi:hypothetical protein
MRRCYTAIESDDGDVINVRDCVVVKYGPPGAPCVARIAALWPKNDDVTGMCSLVCCLSFVLITCVIVDVV